MKNKLDFLRGIDWFKVFVDLTLIGMCFWLWYIVIRAMLGYNV